MDSNGAMIPINTSVTLAGGVYVGPAVTVPTFSSRNGPTLIPSVSVGDDSKIWSKNQNLTTPEFVTVSAKYTGNADADLTLDIHFSTQFSIPTQGSSPSDDTVVCSAYCPKPTSGKAACNISFMVPAGTDWCYNLSGQSTPTTIDVTTTIFS